MTYLKMTAEGAKKHLIAADRGLEENTTLCGCTVTRPGGLKAVAALEGDECEKCASVSFSMTKLRTWLDSKDRTSREPAAIKQPQ